MVNFSYNIIIYQIYNLKKGYINHVLSYYVLNSNSLIQVNRNKLRGMKDFRE